RERSGGGPLRTPSVLATSALGCLMGPAPSARTPGRLRAVGGRSTTTNPICRRWAASRWARNPTTWRGTSSVATEREPPEVRLPRALGSTLLILGLAHSAVPRVGERLGDTGREGATDGVEHHVGIGLLDAVSPHAESPVS